MYSLVEPREEEPDSSAAAPALRRLLLDRLSQAVLALDANAAIVEPVSASMATMFRRDDYLGLRFTELLRPLVPRKFIGIAEQHLAALQAAAAGGAAPLGNPLRDLEVRFALGNSRHELLHYAFEFTQMRIPGEHGTLLVRVTDQTTALLQGRELEDLRLQLRTQSDILQTLLRIGTTRFATVIRTITSMLDAINEILRRPAREDAAFRTKLEQTLSAADRIGRVLSGTSLGALTEAAQQFESALLRLRDEQTLSGNDFLPLAVRLDELSVQFSQVRSLARSLDTAPGPETDGDSEFSRGASTPGWAATASPKFVAQLLEPNGAADAHGTAPTAAGTLVHTFTRLTEHVANERGRSVTLTCNGLELVAPEYVATVKNIVIQFIRNAVVHGIETRAERARAGKPPIGRLRLDFRPQDDGSFELTFEDDGRGIDPESVREVAIARSLITPGDAISLGDRQALKIIFKAKFTTLPEVPGQPRHGAGLAFVRRYVHDAGGVISLGSDPGRSTRFKVTLPPVAGIGLAAAGVELPSQASGS